MEGEIKVLASLDVGVFKSVGYFRAGGKLKEGVKYQRMKLKKLTSFLFKITRIVFSPILHSSSANPLA